MKQFLQHCLNHSRLLLVLILFASLVLHLSTVAYSPVHWMDEIQISEIAHNGIVNKCSNSSLCLLRADGVPDKMSWAIYYLGGLVHEMSYQLMGHAGPRYTNLFLLMVLSLLVYFYVEKKTGDRLVSCVLALLMSALPALIRSVRGGRVDVLAMVFILSSLCVLNYDKKRFWSYVLAGGLAVAAVFSWISAAMLMPIVLCEIVDEGMTHECSVKEIVKHVLFVSIGACGAVVIFLIPFLCNWDDAMSQFVHILLMNTNSGGEGVKRTFQLLPFLEGLVFIPGFTGLGVVLLVARKRARIALIGFVIFATLCILTRVYIYRMIYFSIYALMGCVYFLKDLESQKSRKIVVLLISCMMGVSLLISVVFRNGIGWFSRDMHDYDRIKNSLIDKVGKGPNVRVYLDTFELGYVGRELGWSQVRMAIGAIPSDVAKKMDYYIANSETLTTNRKQELDVLGFVHFADIEYPITKRTNWLTKKLATYGVTRPLGPYVVFVRK